MKQGAKVLPPSWQLALTVCLEHYPAMLAALPLGDATRIDGSVEGYQQMWTWHALEETERTRAMRAREMTISALARQAREQRRVVDHETVLVHRQVRREVAKDALVAILAIQADTRVRLLGTRDLQIGR